MITAHRWDSLIMDMLHLPWEVWEYPLFLTEVAFRQSPLQSIPPSFVFWPKGFRPAYSTWEAHTRVLRSSEYDPVRVHLLGPYNWATYHSEVTKGVSVTAYDLPDGLSSTHSASCLQIGPSVQGEPHTLLLSFSGLRHSCTQTWDHRILFFTQGLLQTSQA